MERGGEMKLNGEGGSQVRITGEFQIINANLQMDDVFL